MGAYTSIMILFVACWVLQIGLSYFQQRSYYKTINENKKLSSGFLGVGIEKTKFNLGKGLILILVTDEDGTVLNYQEMSGWTVFARFRKREAMIGKQTDEVRSNLKSPMRQRAFDKALALIEQEIEKVEV